MSASAVHRGAGSSVAPTAKSSKFSALRNLPAADVSSLTAAPTAGRPPQSSAEADDGRRRVHDTLRQVLDKEKAVEEEGETDTRIRRHRYAQLVARLSAQRTQYYSTGVFVEAMLREAQHAADATPATCAAIATWGLKILARESRSDALTAVTSALLPALYCHYPPESVCTPSPAVQLQVRDRDAVDDNPYFTHTMYADEAQSEQQSTLELRRSLEAAVKANDERRNVVMRFVEREQQMRVMAVFRAWRNHVRQRRLVQLISNSRAKRGAEETAQLRKQATFYQWKLLVERSRSAYLRERLHDAAFQLENAKNQFQLQCYRADRLVQAAKDATSELARVSQMNAELTKEVATLKEDAVRREREFNELLTRSVTRLLRLLGTYDDLSRVFVQSRRAALQSLPAAETSTASSPELASQEGKAEAVKAIATANTLDSPLEQLRQWVDGVLTGMQAREVPFRPIRSLGPDFADGERYLCLLQFVFPDVVSSVLSVQTMGVDARLRRIRDYAVQCKLRYVLLPSDFLNEREDLLVCSLSELCHRHFTHGLRQSTLDATAGLDAFRQTSLAATLRECTDGGTLSPSSTTLTDSTALAAPPQDLDSTAVMASIADFAQRLQQTEEELEAVTAAQAVAVESCIAIEAEEARLGSERLHGAPIPLVEETSRRVFWHFSADALSDLRDTPQLAHESRMWDFTMTQTLPAVLREGVDIVSRLFFFFAGENAKALSEVAFWRFVEATGLLVSPLDVPKQWIVTHYDRVVSPQLDAALKAAARNQNEMSVQKLREVAYQEMDIRTASPTQFVQLIVRIAVGAENNEYGLVEGTRRLLQRLQLPSIERMTLVERDLYAPETQAVLRYFNEDLFRTFLYYIKQQESSRNAQERAMAVQDGGRFSAQMSSLTLLTLLDDCRYLSDGNERGSAAPLAADAVRPRFFISTAQVRKLVPLLERLSKVPPTGYLSFVLFVQVLAALAYHWCTDPMVPAPRRLAAFLATMMQQLNARHINSTLLLGTVPSISLEGPKAVDFSHEARPASANS